MNGYVCDSAVLGKEFELDRFVKAAGRKNISKNRELVGFDYAKHVPFEVFMNENLVPADDFVCSLPENKLIMKYENFGSIDHIIYAAENIDKNDMYYREYSEYDVFLNTFQKNTISGRYCWFFSACYNNQQLVIDIAENVGTLAGSIDEQVDNVLTAFLYFCRIMANPEQVVERTAPNSKIQASRKKHGKSLLPDRRTIRYIHPGQVKTKPVSAGPSKGGTHRSPIEHERQAHKCVSKFGKEFWRRGSVVNKGTGGKLPPMNLVS